MSDDALTTSLKNKVIANRFAKLLQSNTDVITGDHSEMQLSAVLKDSGNLKKYFEKINYTKKSKGYSDTVDGLNQILKTYLEERDKRLERMRMAKAVRKEAAKQLAATRAVQGSITDELPAEGPMKPLTKEEVAELVKQVAEAAEAPAEAPAAASPIEFGEITFGPTLVQIREKMIQAEIHREYRMQQVLECKKYPGLCQIRTSGGYISDKKRLKLSKNKKRSNQRKRSNQQKPSRKRKKSKKKKKKTKRRRTKRR